MQAYDKPAEDAARIRIDEINKAGGLLGKQIEIVAADTKTDRAEGAKGWPRGARQGCRPCCGVLRL